MYELEIAADDWNNIFNNKDGQKLSFEDYVNIGKETMVSESEDHIVKGFQSSFEEKWTGWRSNS